MLGLMSIHIGNKGPRLLAMVYQSWDKPYVYEFDV